jgi:hypothetical protein
MASVLGWSEDEVASRSIFELLHPEDVEHPRAGFELTLVGTPALRFENRYRCKDGGYRWISWVGIQEDGFVYCTGRDVTAEKLAEIELAEAQEALRQSQKMEAIGQLTGGIAHDFNNLLSGILGSLDLVRRRMACGTRPEDIPRHMDAATISAQRAAALTHRLLAFARRQSLNSRPNNVNWLVAGMEDLLRRTLGEQIALRPVLARPGGRRLCPHPRCGYGVRHVARSARQNGRSNSSSPNRLEQELASGFPRPTALQDRVEAICTLPVRWDEAPRSNFIRREPIRTQSSLTHLRRAPDLAEAKPFSSWKTILLSVRSSATC